MWFSRKQVVQVQVPKPEGGATAAQAARAAKAEAAQITTKRRGDAAEDVALTCLTRAGLMLVDRNYRTPGRGGGEIDLVMRDRDGTLVFVEVRQRSSESYGGAGASISGIKQQRIIFAARCARAGRAGCGPR
jgi:putative endonuclease